MRRARLFSALLSCLLSVALAAAPNEFSTPVNEACGLIGGKLDSVSIAECLSLNFIETGHYTSLGRPILYKEYPPMAQRKPKARVLLIGGIHGNEYSSFSVVFKWAAILDKHHSGLFHWLVAPAVNLDGLVAGPATRTNANGVDLNRNLPYADSTMGALEYWERLTRRNPDRYPGSRPLSESETRWLVNTIKEFRPDFIISLHAPYGLLDYDGPDHIRPPMRLGSLILNDLGSPPGSLGHYVGKNIPLLTIELAAANSMPVRREIIDIWLDMVRWLNANSPRRRGPS